MRSDCFSLRISLSSITNQKVVVGEFIAELVDKAVKFGKQKPVKYTDETGWRECSKRARIWLFGTPFVAVALIQHSCGAVVAKALLGSADSWFLISDRWSGYNRVPTRWRQVCWPHLIRDFRKLAESGIVEARKIGIALLEQTKHLLRPWARVWDRTLNRSSLRAYASPIPQEVRHLLVEGSSLPAKKLSGMCNVILKQEPAMWTFLRSEGTSTSLVPT